jgi:hypothetical protein
LQRAKVVADVETSCGAHAGEDAFGGGSFGQKCQASLENGIKVMDNSLPFTGEKKNQQFPAQAGTCSPVPGRFAPEFRGPSEERPPLQNAQGQATRVVERGKDGLVTRLTTMAPPLFLRMCGNDWSCMGNNWS